MLLTLAVPGAAWAGVTPEELIANGMPPEMVPFAETVTAHEGGWGTVNTMGCAGAFQFCPDTLKEFYSGTREEFLADPAAQVDAWMQYTRREWGKAQRNGLTSAVGQQVCYGGTCTTITESSILMACQFGCGVGGKLNNFVKNGYSCDGPFETDDGYGTSVCKYLVNGAGHNISPISGNTSEETGGLPTDEGGEGAPTQGTNAFESIGAFTATIGSLNTALSARITALTASTGDYYRIALMLMIAFPALYLMVQITIWVFQGSQWPTLTAAFARLALLMAVFLSYAITVEALSGAPYVVAAAIQRAALGTDDAFAPMAYLIKVATQIQIGDGTSWASMGVGGDIAQALFGAIFVLIQGIYLLAIVFATIWPMLYFFALKVVGLAVLPFVLAGKLEFMFMGWLRQFYMLIVFVLIVNAVLIANVLLIGEVLQMPFGAPMVGQAMASSLLAIILILAVLGFGMVALFQAQRIAANWTNSNNLSVAGGAIIRDVREWAARRARR